MPHPGLQLGQSPLPCPPPSMASQDCLFLSTRSLVHSFTVRFFLSPWPLGVTGKVTIMDWGPGLCIVPWMPSLPRFPSSRTLLTLSPPVRVPTPPQPCPHPHFLHRCQVLYREFPASPCTCRVPRLFSSVLRALEPAELWPLSCPLTLPGQPGSQSPLLSVPATGPDAGVVNQFIVVEEDDRASCVPDTTCCLCHNPFFSSQ